MSGKDLENSNVSEKTFRKFLEYMGKLSPEEFYGVCKMLGIKITKGEDVEDIAAGFKEPVDLLEECIDVFCYDTRDRRRRLMKLLKTLNKGR